MRKKKEVPTFRSEEQEREFWATHDSADYVEWSRAERVRLANLRPTTRTISIRLPEPMIERLKVLANKRDVPYQSLLKMYVAERIEEELRAEE
ncbi:MAG TPA: BrnA antitoxin family protein [Anaerolineales bacterium]|nr:BrnA antitoxin family protein [Anaerolineales bacterium]